MPTSNATVRNMTAPQIVEEIRRRLQVAHFAARGITWAKAEPLSDQLHAIRLLAEELNAVLGA